MINHHPDIEILMDYASGSLSEGMALAVSTHAWFCDECRECIAELEAVGGAFLDECEPVDVDDDALELVMARLDEPEQPRHRTEAHAAAAQSFLPAPLSRYVRGDIGRLAWRSVGRLFEEARLPLTSSGVKASLMRFRPGNLMPQHSHRGQEYTVVLAGGYSDGGQSFGPGDFASKDSSDNHQPRVDPDEECLCLVVLDAPVRLTGAVGRFVNPFLRI